MEILPYQRYKIHKCSWVIKSMWGEHVTTPYGGESVFHVELVNLDISTSSLETIMHLSGSSSYIQDYLESIKEG